MMFTFFLCLNVTFLVYSVSKKQRKTSEVIVCSRLRKLFSYFTGKTGLEILENVQNGWLCDILESSRCSSFSRFSGA